MSHPVSQNFTSGKWYVSVQSSPTSAISKNDENPDGDPGKRKSKVPRELQGAVLLIRYPGSTRVPGRPTVRNDPHCQKFYKGSLQDGRAEMHVQYQIGFLE